MSVRQTAPAAPSPGGEIAAITEKVNSVDVSLGEGSSYAVASPDHPLRRTVVVSIKSSLNELCLQKTRGTWAPSADALRSIFQQKKFTSLEGAAEPQGDLKAIVLHSMNLASVSSNFPCALGTRITGVDDCTFSSTGEAFSTIILPKANSTAARELQADDVSLAYEFAGKFPGYTAGAPIF